jgi:hypothetical protein
LAPNSFFTGSKKDGDLVVAAPHANCTSRDIWHDQETLHFLKEGTYSPGLSASEKDRVQHRAKGYYFLNELLWKKSSSVQGVLNKVVPRPDLRVNLIRAIHVEVGHYGVKKTYSLLEPTFFWVGMFAQVGKKVAACVACDRVKARFKVKDPELKPLSIMGMFYRWGVDLCKMPFVSADGNKYVVVMIEHFSKWVELIPIPSKESRHTAAALRVVLTRFDAPAEMLTDQGEEFQGEFYDLLTELLIDHRLSSRDHPQSDGLAERMVQTIKEALQKYCLQHDTKYWDHYLCWIAMGYRMSRQASLAGYLPYFLLFGGWPIVRAKVRDVLAAVVDLDDPQVWGRVVEDRAQLFKREMPIAFNNLAIAQHRDVLCYTHRRSGDHQPKLHRFAAGDLVYLKRQKADSMDPRVGRLILRVVSAGSGGRLVLERRNKKQSREHVENCAPCHNQKIDLWQNPELARRDLDRACQVCRKTAVGAGMLLCDRCNEGCHMRCLTPRLTKKPKGDWCCLRCLPGPDPIVRPGGEVYRSLRANCLF